MRCLEASLRPAGTMASLAKPSTNGKLGIRVTVRLACAIGPELHCTRPTPRLERLFPRSRICESAIDLGRVESPAIYIVFTTWMWRAPQSTAYCPANLRRKPTGRPWHRYEKPQPGYRLQIDVKFLERIAGSRKRLYQFTAIDDCTRIRVLKIYDVCNQKSAISFVDEVIRRLPFRVLVIQTDNG